MKDKLTMLYNTLCQIETKGVSTRTMAECLRFIEKLIEDITQNELQKGK